MGASGSTPWSPEWVLLLMIERLHAHLCTKTPGTRVVYHILDGAGFVSFASIYMLSVPK